jgi:hypothetical protein
VREQLNQMNIGNKMIIETSEYADIWHMLMFVMLSLYCVLFFAFTSIEFKTLIAKRYVMLEPSTIPMPFWKQNICDVNKSICALTTP